jgi:hypothetical protein
MPPSPSPERAGLTALLGEQRFVPFVGVYSTCDFGRAVSTKLLAQSNARLRPLFKCGTVEHAAALVDAVVAPSFPASVSPHILNQELPTWVVGFVSRAAAERAALEAFLETLGSKPGLNTFRVLVYATDSLADLPKDGAADAIVVLGSGALASFKEPDTAAIVCAYVRSAWEAYCEAPQRDPRSSLQVPAGKCAWLGIGMDRPDFDYHRGRLAEILAEKVRIAWLAETSPPQKPGFSSARELCQSFLPEEYFHTSDAADLPHLHIGDDTVALRPTDTIRPRRIVRTTTKREWPKQRAELLEYEHILRLSMLPAIEQFALAKSSPLAQSEYAKWLESIRQPEKPTGLFAYLREHLSSAAKITAAWKRSVSRPHPDARPLKENLTKVDDALLSLPSLGGLFLRVALIVVGLGWLTLGPVIWSGVVGVFTHPLLRWVAVISFATTIALCAGAAWNYYYARLRLKRKLELSYTDLERTILWDIGMRLVKAISELELKATGMIDRARAHLTEMTKLLERPFAAESAATNGASHFGDAATVAVLKRDVAGLGDELHRKVATPIWAKGIFISPESQWAKDLRARASEIASEALLEPSYGDWLRAASVSATTLGIISTTMKRFAGQAVAGTAGGHAGEFILIGPQEATCQFSGFAVVRDADLPFVSVVCPRQILGIPPDKNPSQ